MRTQAIKSPKWRFESRVFFFLADCRVGNPALDSLPRYPVGRGSGVQDNPLPIWEDKGQLAPGEVCNLDEIGGRPTLPGKLVAQALFWHFIPLFALVKDGREIGLLVPGQCKQCLDLT